METVNVALSHSQSVLAAIGDDLPDCGAEAPARPWTPVFIVASPRPATGKTFLAHLVADFLRMNGGPVEAFELSPGDVRSPINCPISRCPPTSTARRRGCGCSIG